MFIVSSFSIVVSMITEKISDTFHRLTFADGRQVLLVGTAHVSKESVDEVAAVIEDEQPDHICLELDDGRMKNRQDQDAWSKMDIKKVLKERKGFLLLANMALASFQKRMGDQSGSAPGEEILSAARLAKEKEIPFSLCDREIQITFTRAWRKSNLWNKMKLIATIISAVLSNEKITAEELEDLKKADVMQNMMDEMAKELPSVKEVLIDERDRYLATSIYLAPGDKKLAVIGAGHQGGVIQTFEKIEKGTLSTDLSDITSIPKAGKGGKIIAWAIPVLIVGILIHGFFNLGQSEGLKMFGYWLGVNMSLTAIGAIASLAHPLNAVVSILAAPFTSLHPGIGVGMVSGVLQATLKKPLVQDFERLSNDATTFKGWYRNRVLHILLVFFFTSLGSAIGTFVAFPVLLSIAGA